MPHEPVKIMGCGCLGGLVGAFLGVVIGGLIGAVATPESPRPPVEVPIGGGDLNVTPLINASTAAAGMLLGAGMGGIIGGLAGSVLGAGLAARASSTFTEELRSVPAPRPPARLRLQGSRPANVPELPKESPDAELARLKGRVAELEAKKSARMTNPRKSDHGLDLTKALQPTAAPSVGREHSVKPGPRRLNLPLGAA
jgi:hypothetical protein